VYQISQNHPSFIEDITKKHFGLFFSGHAVLSEDFYETGHKYS